MGEFKNKIANYIYNSDDLKKSRKIIYDALKKLSHIKKDKF